MMKLQSVILVCLFASRLLCQTANLSNVSNINKTLVGLSNVDNTSDATKNAATANLTNKTLIDSSLGTGYLSTRYVAGAAGTTANLLAIQDGASPAGAITASTGSTGVIGVAIATKTVGQDVEIATRGTVNCISSNAVVSNNLVGVGVSVAGNCRDLGTADNSLIASNVQILGRWKETGAAGSRSMQLFGPGNYGGLPVSTTGAGPATAYYLDDANLFGVAPPNTNNTQEMNTLLKTPNTATGEVEDPLACTSGTSPCAGEAYLRNIAWGVTTVPGGMWQFNFYTAVNSTAGGRVSNLRVNTYSATPTPASCTITMTGSLTSRTATATGGCTPFAASVGSAVSSTASWLQTLLGLYRITNVGSSTVATITTPTGYGNETLTAGNASVWDRLFQVNLPTIIQVGTGTETLQVLNSTQGAFTISATAKIGIMMFAVVNNTTTVYFTHNGSARYSYFITPFTQLTIADGATLTTAGAFGLTLTATATTNATFPAGTTTLMSTTTAVAPSQLTAGSTIVAQKFFGTAAPGSIAGNLPGDGYTDTTNHYQYVCNAPAGTAAPACTSVAAAGWLQLNGVAAAQTETIVFRTLCQNTIAGPNFSTPAITGPAFACVTGANSGDVSTAATAWNYGILSFAENVSEATSNSVHGMIHLPSTWASAAGIPVNLVWRSVAIAGDVLFRIRGQCVADAEVPGNFGGTTNFTADTAKGTTLQWNSVATLTLTTGDVLSGCAAGETFLFQLWRDATQGGDTLAGAAELITASFTVTK